MSNTSATGGYLLPNLPNKYPGNLSFQEFLQTVFVGITGLPGQLVRPKWQPNPPKQPDIFTDWLAIGLGKNKGDANAYSSGSTGQYATGTIEIECNPQPGDTLTVNGVLITFVTGTPTGNQVQIGVTPLATATSLFSFLATSLNTLLTVATYSLYSNVITVAYSTIGTVGNSFTLSAMSAGIELSGATLSGGGDYNNAMQRHEDLEITCSIYGPNADDNASQLRDGFQIDQNREALKLANMGFVSTSEAIRVPDLVNERWVDRYELSVFLRRERMRVYPILSFSSVAGFIVTDNPNLKTIAFSANA